MLFRAPVDMAFFIFLLPLLFAHVASNSVHTMGAEHVRLVISNVVSTIDSNNDHVISAQETSQSFVDFDEDHDNEVTQRELGHALTRRVGVMVNPLVGTIAARLLFPKFDLNADDVIKQGEMLPNLNIIDANGDEEVSSTEFENFLLGSVAGHIAGAQLSDPQATRQ